MTENNLSIETTLPLAGGTAIPQLGLGVFRAGEGQGTRQAVQWAIEAGYRHIDTASIYDNETEVGQGIAASGVARESLFVTTKVWGDDQGYESTLAACEASLERIGLDYVDLYLIHWPNDTKEVDTWKALIELRKSGKCRAIGVSNFSISRMKKVADATGVMPEVNQVEFHPFMYREALLNWCQDNQIVLEGYCPLARTHGFEEAVVENIASAHQVTPAQVYLRWALQHGVVIIPKSSQQARIIENASLYGFTLSDDNMKALDGLNSFHSVSWIPPGWTDAPGLNN